MFESFWISNNRSEPDNPFEKTIFYKLPEFSYYANTNEVFELDSVNLILNKYDSFIIELDGLIRVIEDKSEYEYEKGIYVKKENEGLISVSGVIVDHPGHVVAGMAIITGWFYSVENGIWKHVVHKEQCPCNNALRHELQFSLLRILNESLKDKDIIKENDLCYRHKDVMS